MISILLLSLAAQGPGIELLDRLAQSRDVDSLARYLSEGPNQSANPFEIIKTNGAYEVGRLGWHAIDLNGVGGDRYVVFDTPLTSEDVGELVFQRIGDRLKYVPESEDFEVSLVRHSFDLKFDIRKKRADLVDKVQLENKSGTSGPFLFRMSPQYVVTSIVNGLNAPLKFSEAGGVVSTVKPTGSDTYTITYGGVVDEPNYAGSISATEASLVNDYWYPMVARQPVPYDITIHAPYRWNSVGQGDLVSDQETGTEHISTYRMDVPCVFYSVSAGPYKKFSQVIHGRTYSCWSAQISQDQMEAQTEFYAPIIEFYDAAFGKFPFKSYGAIDSQVYGGGALEAYSFTTWGGHALPIEDAHEPSHSWWGGILDNNYLRSFWNESFAVYSDGLYHRNVPIGNRDERRLAFIQDGNADDSYNDAPLDKSGADIGGVAGGLGYGKGSKVLQMLEQILGYDRMLSSLREWVASDHGKSVSWEDFERVVARLNATSDIKGFFDDWVRRPGFANLKVTDVGYADGKVQLNVGFNGPIFRVPLEVMLQFKDGSRSFHTLDMKQPGVVEIAAPKQPDLVSVDPWRRILRKVANDETPVELRTRISSYPRLTDAARRDYLSHLRGGREVEGVPRDIEGLFLVGHPDTMPMLRDLCKQAGFKVDGDKLTYDGTTIDLNHGCAMAVVDLPGGKQCVIGLGKTRVAPDPGRARLVLTDDLGRFIRGKTEPKTRGNLTFRL